MMSIPQVLEGTWEEIQVHGAQLSGHRVKVIVLDGPLVENGGGPPHSEPNGAPTLAEMLAGRIGNVSFDPPELSTRVKEEFGEILLQKHRDGTL